MVKWRFAQRWWTLSESLRRRSLRLSSESASSIPKSWCAITIGNVCHAERYHSLNTWNQSSSVPLSFGLLIAFTVAGMLFKYPVGIRQNDCTLCVHSRLKPLSACLRANEEQSRSETAVWTEKMQITRWIRRHLNFGTCWKHVEPNKSILFCLLVNNNNSNKPDLFNLSISLE